jgi:CDP-diacylglycerol pyrophosphatase
MKATDRSSSRCVTLDKASGFAVIKDRRGENHFLLIPTTKIAGIESSELLRVGTPNYFSLAWQFRAFLKRPGFQVEDSRIALAINSPIGRSQEQLHIHLSCLRSDVQQRLEGLTSGISREWKLLPNSLRGAPYFAKRITKDEFLDVGAFRLLKMELKTSEDMGEYGIAVSALADGGFVLLGVRQKVLQFNFASPGELLDEDCRLPKAIDTSKQR